VVFRSASGVVAALQAHGALILLASIGLILSVIVIPRGLERGLLDLELGRTEEAIAVLETRYREGDQSPATTGALARARAHAGDVAGAVSVLEHLLAQRPRDPALLQTLAGHYRGLQRPEAALAVLERLQAVRPSQASLQDLAALYAELDRPRDRLRVLRELTARPGAETAHFLELAKLEGVLGDPVAGAETIGRLGAMRPRAIDTSVVALEMSLHLSADRVDQAFRRGKSWLAGVKDPGRDALALASVLSVRSHPEHAAQLLVPLADKSADEALVRAASQAEIDSGQGLKALRRIEALAERKSSPIGTDLAILRLRLAASLRQYRKTSDAAEALGVGAIPAELLAVTAAAAVHAGRPGISEAVGRRLAEEQHRLAPILVAETHLALGARDRAIEWANLSTRHSRIDPETAVRLARLELRLLRTAQAIAAFRSALRLIRPEGFETRAANGTPMPASLLVEIARLSIDLDQAAEARAVLGALRHEQPSAEAERAWALAAMAAGRRMEVVRWVQESDARKMPPEFLKDLVFMSARDGNYRLALTAAVHLVRNRGTDGDRLLLAELQAVSGAPWVRPQPFSAPAHSGRMNPTVVVR
jgi:tetratricopeptide (TPR) repeat protein